MDNLYVTPKRVSLRFLDEFELILETNGTFSVLDGAGDALYNTEDRREALILTQKAFTDKMKRQKKASNIGRTEQKVLVND